MKIETPFTYQIMIECIGVHYYRPKLYYSIGRAIQAVRLMNLPERYTDHLFWLVHKQGDQIIGKQRINFTYHEN